MDTLASDTDRAAATDRLREGVAEGKLDLAEYERRVDLALAARTRAELAHVTADLGTSPARARRDYRAEWGVWAVGAVIMTAIWGFQSWQSDAPAFFWPMVPLTIWAIILLTYLFWPADD